MPVPADAPSPLLSCRRCLLVRRPRREGVGLSGPFREWLPPVPGPGVPGVGGLRPHTAPNSLRPLSCLPGDPGFLAVQWQGLVASHSCTVVPAAVMSGARAAGLGPGTEMHVTRSQSRPPGHVRWGEGGGRPGVLGWVGSGVWAGELEALVGAVNTGGVGRAHLRATGGHGHMCVSKRPPALMAVELSSLGLTPEPQTRVLPGSRITMLTGPRWHTVPSPRPPRCSLRRADCPLGVRVLDGRRVSLPYRPQRLSAVLGTLVWTRN